MIGLKIISSIHFRLKAYQQYYGIHKQTIRKKLQIFHENVVIGKIL